jgi:hypothetical protein
MSVRVIEKKAGTSDMREWATGCDIRVDSNDGQLKYYNPTTNSVGTAGSGPIVTYAADGAISISTQIAYLTKAGVGAYTLAAPTALQSGTRLTITNGSANAHVLTATNLLDDGVTGGAKDTATFGAFVGASIVLFAMPTLTWFVESKNVVTIAAV